MEAERFSRHRRADFSFPLSFCIYQGYKFIEASDHAEVIKKIENQELRQEIFGAINELPDKCKEVFKLSYLHDMKNKEIADTLGISFRTVEAHMYKALKFLRERLSHLLLSLIIFSAKLLSVFTS